MNKDFWERIDRLEELAGKATQGEWNVYNLSKVFSVEGGNTLFQAYSGFDSEGHKWDGKVNALYVAAVNPAMIKEMIAEIRSLEKEADWLAGRCAKACIHKTEDCAFQPAYFMDKPCYGENCKKSFCSLDKPEWREAARKALSEADNA